MSVFCSLTSKLPAGATDGMPDTSGHLLQMAHCADQSNILN